MIIPHAGIDAPSFNKAQMEAARISAEAHVHVAASYLPIAKVASFMPPTEDGRARGVRRPFLPA